MFLTLELKETQISKPFKNSQCHYTIPCTLLQHVETVVISLDFLALI